MKIHIVGFLLFGLLVSAAASQQDKADAAKLRGVWRVLSVERDGEKETPKEDDAFFFSFEDGKMTMKTAKEDLETSTIKLDASRNPKEIDIFSGKKGLDHAKGIFSVEGDTLKLCIASLPPRSSKDEKPNVSGPRPTEFAARKGQMRFLLILTRHKP